MVTFQENKELEMPTFHIHLASHLCHIDRWWNIVVLLCLGVCMCLCAYACMCMCTEINPSVLPLCSYVEVEKHWGHGRQWEVCILYSLFLSCVSLCLFLFSSVCEYNLYFIGFKKWHGKCSVLHNAKSSNEPNRSIHYLAQYKSHTVIKIVQ